MDDPPTFGRPTGRPFFDRRVRGYIVRMMEAARFKHRLLALLYDALLLAALLFALSFGLVILNGGKAIPSGTWWYNASMVVAVTAFYCWCWTHGGQTLGMQAWKIRLINAADTPVNWQDALGRSFAGVFSWLPLGLGFFWMLVDRESLTIQDRLSQTRVIDLRSADS